MCVMSCTSSDICRVASKALHANTDRAHRWQHVADTVAKQTHVGVVWHILANPQAEVGQSGEAVQSRPADGKTQGNHGGTGIHGEHRDRQEDLFCLFPRVPVLISPVSPWLPCIIQLHEATLFEC